MRALSLILVPALIVAVHTFALLQGRRGGSRVRNVTFWSGLLGLASMVSVPLLFFLAGPLPVVGPVNDGFASAFNVALVAAGALVLSSLGLGTFSALRRPQ
ncbi:MAG: hypothetical protein NT046_12185 [Arenimonas sp.]|nr:hypothetical protein [Arenimonas sp.]